MVQPNIVFSFEAQEDLIDIQMYIAERSGIQRAELIRERILSTIERIAYGPSIGAVRAFKKLTHDCRAFPEPPWLIVYRPLPTLDGIEVVRVVDSRRDLREIL